MNQEQLFQFFKGNNNSFCATRLKWAYIHKFTDVYEYMLCYFPNIDESTSPIEILYRIENNITEVPKCPVCGKSLVFKRYDRGYGEFCSTQCRRSSEGEKITRAHTEQTFIKKYGYLSATQNQQVKDKIIKTNQSKYGGNSPTSSKEIQHKQDETKRIKYGQKMEILAEKAKNTYIEKTGFTNPMKNPEVKDKVKKTTIKKYGSMFNPEKSKKTCYEKYGEPYYALSQDCKEKRQQTLLKRYGVISPLQSKSICEKQKQTMINKYGYDHNFKNPTFIKKLKSVEIRNKQWETKKKNGSTNSSKIEKEFKQYLVNNGYKFESNYNKDPRYPWHVDFYLFNYDLFIEIQGMWTHGGHPYDANNVDDNNKLELWKNKAFKICKNKKISVYNNAIEVWTKKDVEKRNTAIENNLNYLEIFSCELNECIKLLHDYLNKYKK